MGRRVLLAGATGLVGRECLAQLTADSSVSEVLALVRRAPDPGTVHHRKLHFLQVDFEQLGLHARQLAADQVVCALGTTIKRAGSREAFRRVDFDYPLALARLARQQGARHFLLVSALGADASSRVFYSRVKGELEQALSAMDYPSLTIVRPSLLLGQREEFRLGEEAAKLFGWAAPRRYAPVRASDVASVLVEAAREDRPGQRVIESADVPRR
jgi:uncharacterized protein YbjT (DUF2867 family)